MLFYFRTLSLWVGAMPVVEDVWVRGSLSKFWSGPWLRWRLSIFSLYEVSTVNWQYFSFLGSQGGGSGVVVRTILSRYLKTECNSPYTPSTLAPYCASSCRAIAASAKWRRGLVQRVEKAYLLWDAKAGWSSSEDTEGVHPRSEWPRGKAANTSIWGGGVVRIGSHPEGSA